MKVRAKKGLGQHFLTDLNIARRIAEAVSGSAADGTAVEVSATSQTAGKGSATLEIGGGMGVLTQFLLERDDIRLWGVEIDRESIEYMRGRFPEWACGEGRERGERRERGEEEGRGEGGEEGRGADGGEGECGRRNCGVERSVRRTHSPEQGCVGSEEGRGEGSGGGEGCVGSEEGCGEGSGGGEGCVGSEEGCGEGSGGGEGRLIEGDFLKMDLRERFPDGVRIVGNFPYNISSQIFFKVLEARDLVPEVVGMVQREVAQRIAEPPGSRTYGILSVLLQAWYDIEYLFTVSEGVFSPPPKVKSAVVRLRRNSTRELGCDERLFVKVVKAAFGQRRKMLRNSLRAVFGDFGGAEHPLFSDRAEKLSVAQFVELTNFIEKNC